MIYMYHKLVADDRASMNDETGMPQNVFRLTKHTRTCTMIKRRFEEFLIKSLDNSLIP
jgi:hypothetical protein